MHICPGSSGRGCLTHLLTSQTLGPEATLEDVLAIKGKYGFSGIPITVNGEMGGRLVGMVTNRDTDFVKDATVPVTEIMTHVDHLITALDTATLEEANSILMESKKGKLPILNAAGELTALISRSDLLKHKHYPNATRDVETKRLMCGATIGTRDYDKERMETLVEAGVNVVVLDSSQGDSTFQYNMVRLPCDRTQYAYDCRRGLSHRSDCGWL